MTSGPRPMVADGAISLDAPARVGQGEAAPKGMISMRRVLALFGMGMMTACATDPARETPFVFPEGLRIMEGGYPYAGGPCRLLGETFATSELLDDSADLLGCPSNVMDDPRIASVGRIVGRYEGVVLVSVPKAAAR